MKLHNLDLNKLQVFLIVARLRSLRAAANELGRTPSAVSQSLTSLQKSLGRSLFKKIGTRLFLTTEGKDFFRAVEKNQLELADILTSLGDLNQPLTAKVRLGLYTGCPPTWLSPKIEQLLKRHHQLKFKLHFNTHRELATGLNCNQLDLALSIQPLSELNPNLIGTKLFEEELVLVANSPTELRFLKNLYSPISVIDYFESNPLFPLWLETQQLKTSDKIFEVRVFGSSLHQVVDLVERGLGFAVIPLHVAKKFAKLHVVKNQIPLKSCIWLNVTKGNKMNTATQIVANQLIQN